MEGKLKRKCIVLLILMIIGIVVLVLSINLKGISELQTGYMSGFGTSVTVASFAILLRNMIALKNPKRLKETEIQLTDERNIEIYTKSMAITFRICILIQAIASFVLVLINNELGTQLGLLIGVQLIVFCITNVIISKKI